ncbi:hypothetical protein [Pyrococcus kukulkanii]|uniref:hypothetical protein n=1 Tax=Pyrococcus kukulkanii TaxID=1609559 RepID=UPI003565529D
MGERLKSKLEAVIEDDELIIATKRAGKIPTISVKKPSKSGKKKKVIEVLLLLPEFFSPNEIESQIITGIQKVRQRAHTSYVVPAKPTFLEMSEIKILDIEREIKAPIASKLLGIIASREPKITFEDVDEIEALVVKDIVLPKYKADFMSLLLPAQPVFLTPGEVQAREFVISPHLPLVSVAHPEGKPPEIIPEKDFFEEAFGTSFSFTSEGPVIIFAKKPENRKLSYIEFLKRVLRELYRIRVGGLPEAYHIMLPDKERRLKMVRAGGSITVIEGTGKDNELKNNEVAILKEKLRELFSQEFGFLVFYGKEDFLNFVRTEILETELHLEEHKRMYITQKPIEIKPTQENYDQLSELLSRFWGSFSYDLPDTSIDKLAVFLEDRFREFIAHYTRTIKIGDKLIPTPLYVEGSEGESITHYALKAFVVEYLHNKLEIPFKDLEKGKRSIETEFSLGNIRLDVYVSSQNLAIEVETLYGEPVPLLKLRHDIETRLEYGLNLWIVIPPSPAMLLRKELVEFAKYVKKRYGDRVKVFTIDIDRKELISIVGKSGG